ncbi:hypothetical protein [Mycobacterium lehmannii]|nr:hypothetical protein [Mycobacterium lehmannii]
MHSRRPTLCIYTAEPGFPSESALRLPANWTGTPSTADSDADLPTP